MAHKMVAQLTKHPWLLFVILLLSSIQPAAAQVEFPIGYSSLGGTYAFLALMEEQRLLEKVVKQATRNGIASKKALDNSLLGSEFEGKPINFDKFVDFSLAREVAGD